MIAIEFLWRLLEFCVVVAVGSIVLLVLFTIVTAALRFALDKFGIELDINWQWLKDKLPKIEFRRKKERK